MFGFKIFVRVQTFQRGPPVPLRNFCHPDPEYLDYDNTNFSNLFASDDMDNSSRMRNQSRVDCPRAESAHISERPGIVDNLAPRSGLYIGLLVVMAIHAIPLHPAVEADGRGVQRLRTGFQQNIMSNLILQVDRREDAKGINATEG